jgi:hypothetical protein
MKSSNESAVHSTRTRIRNIVSQTNKQFLFPQYAELITAFYMNVNALFYNFTYTGINSASLKAH